MIIVTLSQPFLSRHATFLPKKRLLTLATLSKENVDVQDVKNGNRKWILSVFQCSDSSNSTVEGKRIR